MRHRGWVIVGSVVACCVFAVGCSRCPVIGNPPDGRHAQPEPESRVEQSAESGPQSAGDDVQEADIAALVAQCKARAEAALIADGETAERAKALASDFAIIVAALANKRFDGYDALMRSKGASLNHEVVRAILDLEAESGRYSKTEAEFLKQSPLEFALERAWSLPERRNAEWTSFDPSGIVTGQGWFTIAGTDHWPGRTVHGRDSMYLIESKGRWHYINLAQNEEIDVRWLQMPVTFGSAGVASLRLKFAYDEDEKMWYPARLLLPKTLSPRPTLLF